MLYLYSQKSYPGLDALIMALGASRLARFDGESFWNKGRKGTVTIPVGSSIVAWGSTLPELEGVRVLNGLDHPFNELEQNSILANNGIRTVKAYPPDNNSPAQWEAMTEYVGAKFGVRPSLEGSVKDPDYYMQLTSYDKEYVIHSFDGKSIRAGLKVANRSAAPNLVAWRMNPTAFAHPVFKTEAGGWTVDHTVSSTPSLRAIVHKTLKVLELTFAEVHVGQDTAGNLTIVEVNLAPNLGSANSIKAYVKAVNKWVTTPVASGGSF